MNSPQSVQLVSGTNRLRRTACWGAFCLLAIGCLAPFSWADSPLLTPEATVTEPLASTPDSASTSEPTTTEEVETNKQANSWEEIIWDKSGSWTAPEGLSNTLQVMIMISVLSLAPAILLMTTCFIRVVVVLGILRQALGTAQLPPTQVLTSLAVFISLLVMSPIWKEVHETALKPYSEKQIDGQEAWRRGKRPLVHFMGKQIDMAGNTDDVWLFYDYLPSDNSESLAEDHKLPETYDEIPLQVLLPAYVLSELKTAFLIGFQIFLPFLVLDLVVASVTISMGMLMVPPAMISLPFKLLLFVLVDGWHLVVGMLMESLTWMT